jgi:hypothetical protein
MSAADDLHERLFGFRPKKAGTAYERLAAVVLAGRGWENVRHDTKLRLEGRLATHQLDVSAKHPDGTIRRLLVECKDWNKRVGKKTVDALVGVRDQSGFDAAMAVTTEGFTGGALDVAVDEDIVGVVLRNYQPEDEGRFIRRIEMTFKYYLPTLDSFDIEIDKTNLAKGTELRFRLEPDDRFRRLDGAPAETFREVVEAQAGPMKEGTFQRLVEFKDGRLVVADDGTEVRMTGLKWVEKMLATTNTSVIEGQGEPCLVLEQLDEAGEPRSGRLVVDRELYAWDIDDDGNVVPRGDLS